MPELEKQMMVLRTPTPTPRCLLSAALAVALVTSMTALPAGQTPNAPQWVTAWGSAHRALGEDLVTNATVRMIARVTIPGDAVRVRLSNVYGTEPMTVGSASVGLRGRGGALIVGSARPLTFSGSPQVVIPPGGTVTSDAAPLPVRARQDVAVSLYVPGDRVRPSQHTGALVTSYRTPDGAGDITLDEAATGFVGTTTAMWWLKSIDVQSTSSPGAIVAFGDSITDGTCSTLDAHDRWEDLVSVRLGLDDDAARQDRTPTAGLKAVVNEGIGGNTITREGLTPPPDSTPGLERLDRDVLSHHGVRDVVLFMGTNDIRRGATAANLISGMTMLAERIKARGIRVIGATIIPRHNRAAVGDNSGWTPEKTRIRNEVNTWIRTTAPFDAVIDFSQVVRDPADPDRILPAFDCGDGIHPSVLGYYEMGRAVDLSLFTAPR
jgi:lysophospholipase L1-like esterase